MAPLAAAAAPGGATAASRVHVARHVVLVGELAAAAGAGEARLDAALVLAVPAQVAPRAVQPAAALTLRGRRSATASAAATGTTATTASGAAGAAALAGEKVPQRRQELVCNTAVGESWT